MDLDEALARALQQEEVLAAKAGQGRSLLDQLQSAMDKVTKCEDELLQALALSVMPLEQLQADAAEALTLNATLGGTLRLDQEDLLAQKLLDWFKHKFFSWTDRPPCEACGSKETQGVGTQPPTAEEQSHGAGRTEVYSCTACNAITRFPRYNDPGKLLETRTGRCGEWANCFLLVLRAAGLTARYILDVTDHVWCEYYSAKLGRWVHLDPCEAAFDKPLLYEAGWGKKLSYVVAIGTAGFVDVTRRYTRNWSEVASRRTSLPEAELTSKLGQLNASIRAGLPRDLANKLQVRDLAEQLELLECVTAAALDPADAAALPGRTTGSLQWRQERGETGQQQPDGLPRDGTAYASAKDSALGPVFAAFGRIRGGACRAAGDNAGEGAAMAFDGRVATKWLDFGGGGASGATWLEYRLLAEQPAVAIAAYDIVSGNDSPERDPCSWVLEGIVEKEAAGAGPSSLSAPVAAAAASPAEPAVWTQLDKRSDVKFGGRHELRTFEVGASGRVACRALRLRVLSTRDPSTANSLQLSCLNLYTAAAFPGSSCADAGAAAEAVAAVATGAGPADPNIAAASTLSRILSNIAEYPKDPKYRRVRAAKLPPAALLAPSLALLASVGFRPLLLPLGEGATAREEDVFLGLAAGEEAAEAVGLAAVVLKERLSSSAAGP